jgi:hypothetical protein
VTRFDSERLLVGTIEAVLSEYPELAGAAASAISSGVARGVARVQQEANEARNALSLSLALIGANHMTDSTKKMLKKRLRASSARPAVVMRNVIF